jgi:NhaP-type Na+/H+ or K+/H+ antiporter
MTVDGYEVALLAVGVVVLLAAWLPGRLADRPLSLPIVLVVIGVAAFALPIGVRPDVMAHGAWVERATELGVIVSLTGAGLKLDRPMGWRTWRTTWRLLAIAMPLTILVVTVASLAAGMAVGSALLVGAALAPTDPVLAADVQVGEPSTGDEAARAPEEDEVRFALTSEAGLNDSLAFPFVYAAIWLTESGGDVTWSGWWRWLGVDLMVRVAVGVVAGVVVGWLLSLLIYGRRRGREPGLATSALGFVALATTLIAYGVAEFLHGYGFMAVFVAATTIRAVERTHEYLSVLHDFGDEVEQLLVVALLVLFGGALLGGLLDGFDVWSIVIAVTCVFVARPAACWVALRRGATDRLERRLIGFFGIRGVGSFYYVAYAATAADVPGLDRVWAAVTTTVLLSIVVHGVLSSRAMRALDRRPTWRNGSARRRAGQLTA